jgi:hypothetical protein
LFSATQVALDTPAPELRLPATDGKTYALDDVAGEKGTVMVFICNHCLYVKAVIDRMVSDARVLMSESVGFAAICSNDASSYPEDSFENMKRFAKAHDLPFPYLHDETQTVERAYGAICTPDFFGYNGDRKLKYRGRLDKGRRLRLALGRPESLSRPCVRLRPPVWRRLTKRRLLAAHSNGRTNRVRACAIDLSLARRAPRVLAVAIPTTNVGGRGWCASGRSSRMFAPPNGPPDPVRCTSGLHDGLLIGGTESPIEAG